MSRPVRDAKNAAAKKVPMFKVGWLVTVTMKLDTAPRRCYTGEIQALNSRGIRLTQLGVMDRAEGFDLYVPYRNIDSALVATDEHDQYEFPDRARQWSEGMCNPEKFKQKNDSTPAGA